MRLTHTHTRFILSTTENYPFIMYPAYDYSPVIASIFFFSYIMLMVYIVLALFQAAVYKAWSQELESQELRTRVRTYHSLLAAYHVLLDDSEKELTLEMWTDLVTEIKGKVSRMLRPRPPRNAQNPQTPLVQNAPLCDSPTSATCSHSPPPLFTLYEWLRVSHLCASQDASPDDARLSFLIMDVDEDGSITVKEFLQGCVHAISYNFEHIRLELKEGEMMRSGKELCGKGARTFVKRIMRRKLFK